MRKEIENWWKQAQKDLEAAEKNLKIREYYLVAFLCQQALEKGLKALLIKRTNKFPKVHDLTKLGRLTNSPKNILNSKVVLKWIKKI